MLIVLCTGSDGITSVSQKDQASHTMEGVLNRERWETGRPVKKMMRGDAGLSLDGDHEFEKDQGMQPREGLWLMLS